MYLQLGLAFTVAENWYAVTTPDENTYRHVWLVPEVESLEFYVRACSQAHILLSSRIFDASVSAYEIELGFDSNQR